jgi:hypothetical protein
LDNELSSNVHHSQKEWKTLHVKFLEREDNNEMESHVDQRQSLPLKNGTDEESKYQIIVR